MLRIPGIATRAACTGSPSQTAPGRHACLARFARRATAVHSIRISFPFILSTVTAQEPALSARCEANRPLTADGSQAELRSYDTNVK
jgi:hypothetical protein